MKLNHWLYALVLMLLFVACSGSGSTTSTDTEKEHGSAHAAHWSYTGEEGPEHWGSLDSTYEPCKSGKSQSPIDLTAVQKEDVSNITFHYQPSDVQILNNGHTVQVNYDEGSYIEVESQKYNLVQYHYHSPSEHTVNGTLFAAELHLVHKNAEGNYAVLGILFKEGLENSAYQPFLTNLPAEKSDAKSAGVKINAMDLLPKAVTTFRYLGSLTTPPCTEGVNWFVFDTPVEISADQVAQFKKVFEGNNRQSNRLMDDH